jgi:hypothetical protein
MSELARWAKPSLVAKLLDSQVSLLKLTTKNSSSQGDGITPNPKPYDNLVEILGLKCIAPGLNV